VSNPKKNDGTKLDLVKVDFYGDQIEAAKDGEGKVWVSLRKCCQNLGISVEPQLAKLKRKRIVKFGKPDSRMTIIVRRDPNDNKPRPYAMIDVKLLPGWLFSIEPSKVKPEVREKLERYQDEAEQVLVNYFLGQQKQPASAADPTATLDAKYVMMMNNLVAMSHRISEVSTAFEGKVLAAVRLEVELMVEKRLNDELEKRGMTTAREPLVSIRDRVGLHGFYNPSARQMAQIRNYTNDLLLATTGESPLVLLRTCMYRPHQVPLLDRAIEVILRKTEEMTKGGLFDQQDNTPAN